jgi:hypothetical protein
MAEVYNSGWINFEADDIEKNISHNLNVPPKNIQMEIENSELIGVEDPSPYIVKSSLNHANVLKVVKPSGCSCGSQFKIVIYD